MKKETNLKTKYVAYYRVSTERQDLDTQKRVLRKHLNEEDIIAEFEEIESGSTMYTNPNLNAAVEFCKENNCILASVKIDRLGRNLSHAVKVAEELDYWIFIPHLNQPGTKIPILIFSIFSAIAQSEREWISERTKEKLQSLKAQGVTFGRKKPLTPKQKAIKSSRASMTMLSTRFNDPKYKKAKKFILKRMDEWMEKNGKTARKYWSRQYDDIYQEIADELNDLGAEVPDYLRRRDKFLSRHILDIYRNETKTVTLQYQFEELERITKERSTEKSGVVSSNKQDSFKSG